MIKKIKITEKEFEHISSIVYNLCGINLHQGKKELVQSRLGKRLRRLGLNDFKQYINYVENDITREEFTCMVDILSTNLTSFFREENHFDFFKKIIISHWNEDLDNRKIRIWSAGCSSGEEAYTIAIVIQEARNMLNGKDIKILATDISTRMLEIARKGIYAENRIRNIPSDIRRKYFSNVKAESADYYSIKPVLQEIVRIGRLNLLGEWPMKSRFDLIYCRNVMIYFDKPTQEKLINRFWNILKPEGILFVGHSESLTGTKHRFKYIQPTIYKKV